jgi:hypothetical protein
MNRPRETHTQAFLREGGLVVGEATVIKQAQVTALADSNGTRVVLNAVFGLTFVS